MADVSGIFFLSAVQDQLEPRYQAFSGVPPVERIGNLLIYRGTFHLPWLRERQLLLRRSQGPHLTRTRLEQGRGTVSGSFDN